ncbi:MAG TPA: tetratricopeptide repeat protein [Polyangiaceae bacterium]|nr:tetratricopeptide repeat protein [Polyangiaceae bacterium]
MRRVGIVCVGVAGFVASVMFGCSSGTPPAQAPSSEPPSLADDDQAAAAAPASSSKVKEGIDAIQAQDFAKAKAVLEEAVKETPKDPQASFYLGVADEALGDGKGAAEQYRHALELDPKLTEASTNLSGVLLDQGDATGALAAADAGLKVAPKSPSLLRNRAVALDQTGSKDAVAAFKAAVDAAPNDKEVQYLYAEALAKSGDQDKAVAELKPLLGSDDVAVLASAGRLFGKMKDFDDCVAALDKAISSKDVAELRVERGLCKHGKKDEKGAEDDFNAAVKADPNSAPAHYYLGQSKRAHGDKKGAKAELTKAAELDPSGGLGAKAKKELAALK